jgi:hypothetical protein
MKSLVRLFLYITKELTIICDITYHPYVMHFYQIEWNEIFGPFICLFLPFTPAAPK